MNTNGLVRSYAVKVNLYDISAKRVTASLTAFRTDNVSLAMEYAQDLNQQPDNRPPLVQQAIQALMQVIPGTQYTITASVVEE